MAKDKLTRATLRDPYVVVSTNGDTFTVSLEAYRDRPRGGIETFELVFADLNEYELRCIGKQIVQKLREKRNVQDARTERILTDITGWAEGKGPGARE